MANDIKILPGAAPLLPTLSDGASIPVKAAMESAIKAAASIDGDRVLDTFEAKELAKVHTQIVGTSGALTSEKAMLFTEAMAARAAELKAARPTGTEVIFTSEGKALKRFREKIIGAMQDTITKAEGRPVDINMMLFAFTDKELADSLLEMARQNPNAHFRLMTDWSQLSTSGSRQPPRLSYIAQREGLDNLEIKYKKDNPYIWDAERGRPRFHHGATKGLNHHKGFVTLIDGVPEKMAFGSFNWSIGAMKRNYENLMLLDRMDPDNRRVMQQYDNEFAAFWNNEDLALTFSQAREEKNRLYQALYDANGAEYDPMEVPPHDDDGAIYRTTDAGMRVDLNSFGDEDMAELETLVGRSLAKAITAEFRAYGRFDSWTELLVRVPEVAQADAWTVQQLRENVEFGTGEISINTATASELKRAGLTSRQAANIVAFREEHGSFETIEEADAVRGIGPKTLAKLYEIVGDDEAWAAFSARIPGGEATTGFAESNRTTVRIPTEGAGWPADLDGNGIADNRDALVDVENTLDKQVADMLRRTEAGQTFRLAMYGMSTSSPEYKELVAAADRGVKVRVVIYGKYNGKAIAALQKLQAEGKDVDVRVIKSRVMHEKFGVVGDDVFNGSSNWSSSSIKKHSEDRFTFRNMPALADRFVEEFARLWDRGNPPR